MTDAATLMDRVYARQRHIYDATRKFYLLGRDGLIADLDAPPRASILEIGCGTGRNLIAIARRYPDARCYGLDISREMLATAQKSIESAGLASRILIVQADATAFDAQALFGTASFDRVVISYALSMIPPWREVLKKSVNVLAPKGSLRIVDFGDQARLPRLFKTALRAWLHRFHVAPRDTLTSEIDAVGKAYELDVSSRARFRGYTFVAALSRY